MEFSQAIADSICDQLVDGKSMRAILRGEGMPSSSMVYRSLENDAAFREQYARAREWQADTLADEIQEIADDGRNDKFKDEDGNTIVDHDVIARSRLRVDARKWAAAKLKPKVYGEKTTTELSGLDGKPIEVETRPKLSKDEWLALHGLKA